MKIINVLEDGEVAASIISNDEDVGRTLLLLKMEVHADKGEHISFGVKDSDNLQDVAAWLSDAPEED